MGVLVKSLICHLFTLFFVCLGDISSDLLILSESSIKQESMKIFRALRVSHRKDTGEKTKA